MQKAVLYVNTDDTTRGFLDAGGSPSMQHMINQVAAGVIDPETKVSELRRERAALEVRAAAPDAEPMVREFAALAASDRDIPLQTLGGAAPGTETSFRLRAR
jgi:N-acetylated-alpha-linked acidic dipeptidase